MKKNKKGFTLVELLGVLVILALLIILISRPIIKMLDNTKTEISASQEKSILNAAEKWSVDNSNKFDDIEGTMSQIGLDILFVLDVSASMQDDIATGVRTKALSGSKFYAMIQALNSALEVLESDNNEILVTTFGQYYNTFLPLGSYSSNSKQYFITQTPITLISNAAYNTYTGTDLMKTSNGTKTSVAKVTRPVNESYTYTQQGLDYGIKQLLASRSSVDAAIRIPVVILLTDGVPNGSSASLCNSCTTAKKTATGLADAYYYALMMGYEGRQKISSYYTGSNEVFFYTIGFGVDSDAVRKMLDPGKYSQTSAYNYVTEAFIDKTMSAETLKGIFSGIANEVVEATKVTQVCVTVQDLYDGGYLSTKDIKLANDEAASQYVLMSYNEAMKQYGFSLAKTTAQIDACKALLEETTP